MTTNYNFEPYYDDFVDTKNYVKVLFKPGVAVQARELTQIQTAIQRQIKSMGGFLFKNESLVSGGKASAYVVNWIDVVSSDLSSYVGKNLVGVTSNAKAKVVTYKNTVSSGVSRLYFVYTNGNKFGKAETINQDTTFPEVQSIVTLDTDANTGPALAYSMTQAVFFVKDYFVVSPEQTVIVGDSLTPTAKIGLEVVEEVVTYQDDETLLDPASGSYNYAAPGADRVAITLTLTVYPYNVIEGTDADEIVDTTDNFIEVARYVAGVSAFQLTDPTLGGLEDVFARRTFDESGDYTVRSFSAKAVNNVYRQQDLLSISIEPGKAYVKGYEFETKSTLHLDLEKSRDYKDLSNFYGEAAFGDYFLIANPTGGILSYTENPEITFTGATGTARVRGVERVNSTQIKLFVYNVRVTTGAIKDITAVNAGTWTASVLSTNPDKLYKAKNGSYLISMNNSPIKEVVDISYTTQTMVSGNATTDTTLSPISSLPSGKTYVSSIPEDYVVVKQSDGTVVTGFTVAVSGGQTFALTGTFTNGATYNVFAKVAVSTPTTKSKIRTTTTVYLTNSNSSKITLGVSDCYKIVSIIARSSVNLGDMLDVTGRYTLVNGQTDSLYDYGSIVLKSRTLPAPLTQYNRLAVTLEYFEESQNSGFFTGNSYNTTTSDSSLVVPYENIQNYTTTSGVTYSLRDVFDFRPRRDKIATFPGTLAAPIGSSIAATITGNEFIKPSSSITCDYSYYISRIDKLIVTKEKKFDLIRGIPSDVPQVPSDSPDAMTLYTLFIPAYTFKASDVVFNYIENRRYTMRDIGKIDKRVNRLEYYTAMSLLEKQAADETILNSAGLDKFKNGILVDSFAGFGVSDVSSSDYSCSIDTLTRTLRPRFSSDSFLFDIDTLETNSSYYSKKSDLLTLPYTTSTYVENTQATNWCNLNPYMVFKWNGEVVLSPSSDVWSDKETLPDVVTNINGANDAFTIIGNVANPASVGVKWADWQLVDKGIVVNSSTSSSDNVSYYLNNSTAIQSTATTTTTSVATTVSNTYYANGLSMEKSAVSSIIRDLGSKVVDASLIPYIRSSIIDFSATKLKPDTVLFASFDDVDVTRYCSQAPVIYTTTVANATKVRKVGTSKTADILLMRTDRAFVKMYPDEYMFSAGDILEWFVGTNWVVSGTVSEVIVRNSADLVTDENGDIAGYFYLPNNDTQRFRTGERSFLLADTLGIQATTAAESKYVAQGMSMSLQKDIISTQVQTVELNPVSRTKTTSSTTVQTSSNTVIANKDVTVLCGQTQSGAGASGKFVYTLNFGTDIGSCGINYDPSGIPDRYTIIWNGHTYTSGFRGFGTFGGAFGTPVVNYDNQLNALGFPSTTNVIDANNPSAGRLRFNKTSIFPNTATLIVDAPLSGTRWAYKAICPGKTDNLLPETDPKIQVIVDTPATHNAAWGATSVTYNFTVRIAGTQNVPTGTPVKITSIGRSETSNGRWASFASGTRISGPNGAQVASFPFVTTVGSTLTYTISYDTTATARTSGITGQNSLRSPSNLVVVGAELVTAIDGFLAQTSGSDTTTITQSLPAPPPSSSSFGRGCGDDPLAQTFFVSAANNPDGIFIDAVDVFFRSKPVSDNVAVSLQIRPTVNGYPSSTEVLPFATSDLLSKDVVVSANATINKVATRFQLKAPVYLAPNTEYAIVLRANSTEYEVFTSVIGSFLLSNSTTRATKQPGTGSLFLSSNGTTWTAEQASSMLFRVKKCVFPTNTNSSVVLNTKIPSSRKNGSSFSYDAFFMDGEVLDFASTNVNYSFRSSTKISFLGTNYVRDSAYTEYQLGSNVALPNRKSLSMTDNTTLKAKYTLTTTNADVSPVVDLSRMSSVLIQNIINNNSNSETEQKLLNISSVSATTGAGSGVVTVTTSAAHGLSVGDYVDVAADTTNEINGNYIIASTPLTTTFTYTRSDAGTAFTTAQTGFVTRKAQAQSRYITRKVTLNQDFYSSDIKAYFYASIPTGCSVIPYYKAATVSDINIDDNNWIPMRLETSGTADRNGFVEYKYKAAYDISADTFALPAGDKFGSFVVKLVMLSSDTTKVPLIRDLRVLALDD